MSPTAVISTATTGKDGVCASAPSPSSGQRLGSLARRKIAASGHIGRTTVMMLTVLTVHSRLRDPNGVPVLAIHSGVGMGVS